MAVEVVPIHAAVRPLQLTVFKVRPWQYWSRTVAHGSVEPKSPLKKFCSAGAAFAGSADHCEPQNTQTQTKDDWGFSSSFLAWRRACLFGHRHRHTDRFALQWDIRAHPCEPVGW